MPSVCLRTVNICSADDAGNRRSLALIGTRPPARGSQHASLPHPRTTRRVISWPGRRSGFCSGPTTKRSSSTDLVAAGATMQKHRLPSSMSPAASSVRRQKLCVGVSPARCCVSSLPAARRVWTPVAAPPGERQSQALAGSRESGRPQAPGDCRSPRPSRRRGRGARTPRCHLLTSPRSAWGADRPAFVCEQVCAVGLAVPRVWRTAGLLSGTSLSPASLLQRDSRRPLRAWNRRAVGNASAPSCGSAEIF